MKYVNSFSSSTTSIPTAIASASNVNPEFSFEDLVSKLFACNIVLVLTDQAKQFIKNCYGASTTGTTFANILNQFAVVNNIHSTIRDLNGHNAYALNKLQFRFHDVEQFKSRPTGNQLRKLHFDVISSMSNSYLNNPIFDNDNEMNCETPWYDLWCNIFLDTFEQSEHDFIGSNCGCFFVITKHELPHYKVIFERLCASVKQNSTLRFIQSDFVRYFIVLSDQILEPASVNTDEYTKSCHNLKAEFPNSFILFIDPQYTVQNQNEHSPQSSLSTSHQSSIFIIGDTDSLNSEMNSLTMDDKNISILSNTDPLNAAKLSELSSNQQPTNSRFYNELVNQRNQLQKESTESSIQNSTESTVGANRDLLNDWVSSTQRHEHLREVTENLAETINLMLREFISKSLVPWAERQIKILGELIAQRKGFRKSIFSATKSLIGSMSSSTASLTKTLTGTGSGFGGVSSGVFYIPDAQEMQQRKLADICMTFGVYEMAYNLYYAARKDFQSEGAWLYYAGASEMSAIASYFIQKYHLNYFEQAIITYIDTCSRMNNATRTAILATELFCQLNRHSEAANLYRRLLGDDSDLRSALFLEQASKCYLILSKNTPTRYNSNVSLSQMPRSASSQSLLVAMSRSTNIETVGILGSRYRKAAFYYILAGHRYNRCGLKHFALMCYRRFNYPHWDSASDHVNLTTAKLFLNISTSNVKKFADYYVKGLEIYRRFSHKQIFYLELLRELKRYHIPTCDTSTLPVPSLSPDLYNLEIPFIHSCLFVSFDSFQPQELTLKSRNQRHTCFVGEQVEISFTMSSPFPITISHLRLICDQPESVQLDVQYTDTVQFETNEQMTELILKLMAQTETQFSLIGVEYMIDGIPFRKDFSDRMRQMLKFKSIKTLPLIPIEISIPQMGLDAAAVNRSKHAHNSILKIPGTVYGSEMITLKIVLSPADSSNVNWVPSSMQLFTTAKQCYPWPVNGSNIATVDETESVSLDGDLISNEEHQVPIQYRYGPIDLQIHIPPKQRRHLVSIRLVYTDENKESRTILRKLCFDIVPCIDVEAQYDSVATIRNLCPSDPIAIFDVTVGNDQAVPVGMYNDPLDASFVSIPIDHSTHLLLLKSFVRWTLPIVTNGDGRQSHVPNGTLCRNGMILFS